MLSSVVLAYPFGIATPAPASAPPTFTDMNGLVSEYCVKCHGEKVQKAGVNFAIFKDEKALLRDRKLWRSVIEQLKSGEMPPEGQKQPTKEQRAALVNWLTATLDAADVRDRTRPDPGRSVVRRLTRYEYNRSVRDLLGIEMDAAGAVGMPDETVGEAFDNLAAGLSFSDSLMEKYFAAADLILEKLYSTAPKKNQKPKPGVPPAAFELVVFNTPGPGVPPRAAARDVVAKLARRAYRRPVAEREIERLLGLFDTCIASGLSYEEALKPVFKAILVSPNFLLRIEANRAQEADAAYRVSDHELAVRLSYFLWSTMPDDELFQLAETGELGKPEVFGKQVRRMLADPKARALTESFASQWLQLRKLPDARPSTEFFPTFTPALRRAMSEEAMLFFDGLRTDDRSILDLLDADYTFMNADLAKHYGITGISGNEMRRVKLSDPNRGGLLGMAAMLTVTSHTNRTSPTLRGKYVLDVLLGTPPPPPPPNVSQIDESKKGKEANNFRELLSQHATQPACAGCHAKIDPLGFGLENFDAVGRFRKSSADVDATGKLPGGDTFNGPRELKQVLLKRKDRFAENLTEKLFVYALGRELQSSDTASVKAITAELVSHDYRFSTLVLGITTSYAFQYRRNHLPDENE